VIKGGIVMDLNILFPAGLLLAGFLALARMQRKGWIDASPGRVRRGTGHAMLGLQEFIEPSVEHIFEAENLEQKDEDDRDASEDDPETIRADLSTSLGRDPVDHEEVRRHLATARRAGLDWREVYEQAVRDELSDRPFRSPSLPPPWRVAPREEADDPPPFAPSA
jgi:hypothetical protein